MEVIIGQLMEVIIRAAHGGDNKGRSRGGGNKGSSWR